MSGKSEGSEVLTGCHASSQLKKSRMKILLFASSFLPKIGGSQLAIHNLAEGLTEIGHDVLVATPLSRKNHEFAHGYKLEWYRKPIGFGLLGLTDRWYKKRLKHTVQTWNPDLVHAHVIWPAGVWAAQVLKGRKPLVLTAHGEDIQRYPDISYGFRLDPEKKKIIEAAVFATDALISIGNDIHAEYRKIGLPEKKIRDIPNAVNTAELSRPLAGAKDKLGISSETPVVLAVGRNHPKKGFPDLVRIIGHLKNEIPDILCLIVGRDSSSLQPLVDELDLQDNIRLSERAAPVGFEPARTKIPDRDRITTFFKAADVYAMPSLVESFGIVTVEAMAAGLPIVAFQAPGTVDLVKDNENGFLVEPGNLEDFAEKLSLLLRDEDRKEELGLTARDSAKIYDRKEVAQKHSDFYRKILIEHQAL